MLQETENFCVAINIIKTHAQSINWKTSEKQMIIIK